jgi:hypothetical protein
VELIMSNAILTDSETRHDDWTLEKVVDELREIVHQELPQVTLMGTTEELSEFQKTLLSIQKFANTSGNDGLSEIAKAARHVEPHSKVKHSVARLYEFCNESSQSWERLDSDNVREQWRASFRAALSFVQGPAPIEWREVVIVGVVFVLWIFTFALGYTMHAKPYQSVIEEPGKDISLYTLFGAVFMFILSSIPTNVLLLSGLAGCLGTAYRRASTEDVRLRNINIAQDYLCGITTSFVVYICMLAGLLALSVADTITNETQEKHIQLAGTVSLCSFLVGYDRQLVVWLLRRAANFFSQEDGPQDPSGWNASNQSNNQKPVRIGRHKTNSSE